MLVTCITSLAKTLRLIYVHTDSSRVSPSWNKFIPRQIHPRLTHHRSKFSATKIGALHFNIRPIYFYGGAIYLRLMSSALHRTDFNFDVSASNKNLVFCGLNVEYHYAYFLKFIFTQMQLFSFIELSISSVWLLPLIHINGGMFCVEHMLTFFRWPVSAFLEMVQWLICNN